LSVYIGLRISLSRFISIEETNRLGLPVTAELPKDIYTLMDTALCKRVSCKVFVESRTPRGSQQKLGFYLSAKPCMSPQAKAT
jgi:hypothetical protein